ncbi:Flagellar biosynthetic protein FlhB [Sporomusa acidovorans DSM 3132]|uniref:Flagellar biosynthetic protein FlhB n=1 Tax=Sporomusa acidovorans (strain ATCC 49682 / DSM 3132 / Mol) TaxID=1123286 RepID=A0ABZ3J3S2_SPOA4|nr:flagellar biosynthetic protein FlhB [Sporomusa acidovorans DSM 3132]SDD45782.1 flagellar biosynthetic protein FlhB [Sporomusa acidovorans]
MKSFIICTASWKVLHQDKESRYRLKNFDLQLFNGEKTEDATPKRKEEARKKGQVAKSSEISSVFVILAAFYTLKLLGVNLYNELASYMTGIFSGLTAQDLTINAVQLLFIDTELVLMKTMLPILLVIMVISVVINFMQVGFMFSTEVLMPDFSKINPLSGFQRLFSKRSLVELAKALFKVAIIGYFIYRFAVIKTGDIPQIINMDLMDALKLTGSLVIDLAFQIIAVMLVLAVLDYMYQWWEHNESLKMSKEEVKEEMKQTEGNPQIKSKIKEKQRALAMRRMMQEIPKADVVVTNPTHLAIALKYEKEMAAPVVLAKGQDFLAERIKQVARENKVVIVENKPLARALYSAVEIGDIIPAELYQAVAEVLAYVYRLKKRLS